MLQKADMMNQAKSKFVEIKPPMGIDKSSPGPADSLRKEAENLIEMPPKDNALRFNYESYMKNLTDKISGSAPNANAYIGSDF